MLNKISISGFKSIENMDGLELRNLNIIIGANGAGKSNFVQIFQMLKEMSIENGRKYIFTHGRAKNFLFNGAKVTKSISAKFDFDVNTYRFELTPDENDTHFLFEEWCAFRGDNLTVERGYGSPSEESRLKELRNEKSADGTHNGIGYFIYENISQWVVYHLHDTSIGAPLRKSEIIDDNAYLRHDASNLAPFLLHLKQKHERCYQEIIRTLRLIIPFFDDFRLDVEENGSAQEVKLSWQQKGSDFPMQPHHLSDGSIRFIGLATVLLQPNPPDTIIIDEPELGLHPDAIFILSELIDMVSNNKQVIVATQSPELVNYFGIEDIIVAKRENGASTFSRLNNEDYSEWLEEYTVGDLWKKGVLGGEPEYE